MITKNETYGISENVTIADFGTGDIVVADGFIHETKTGCLMLANDVPNDIGKDHPERIGKTTDEVKQDVVFTFTNVESINVVIRALERAKIKMMWANGDESLPSSEETLQGHFKPDAE